MSTHASSLPLCALVGSPNCGKSALFNALTGAWQKTANYAGVTVERREGITRQGLGERVRVLDLPGTYSLVAHSDDERVTTDFVLGRMQGETPPDLIICVIDATNLALHLRLVLEVLELGFPTVVAVNMADIARKRGMVLDRDVLERELGVPVVTTAAIKRQGVEELHGAVTALLKRKMESSAAPVPRVDSESVASPVAPLSDRERFLARTRRVAALVNAAIVKPAQPSTWTSRVDTLVLHPVAGPLILIFVLLMGFQALFNGAAYPQDLIEQGMGAFGERVATLLPSGVFRSLLVDGVIAGVGSVLVFLPQILILFGFILLLEDSGYMARAAFLMDRIMGRVGLNGRAFLPLLSGFACAIPGMMSARTIEDRRDRLATILVVPFTTCSARLPVYAMLIAAFIPNTPVLGPFRLQGLVLLGLYGAGVASALLVAFVLRSTILSGARAALVMELPVYKLPAPANIFRGLWERARQFLVRAGTFILPLTVLLWFLATYPRPPVDSHVPAINTSFAGIIGHWLEPLIAPLGFDWKIAVALVPGFGAREILVSALGTVYALDTQAGEDATVQALSTLLPQEWSLATALALLAWYIFAPQCLSTYAVMSRETRGWRWPAFSMALMLGLAYGAAFLVYRVFS